MPNNLGRYQTSSSISINNLLFYLNKSSSFLLFLVLLHKQARREIKQLGREFRAENFSIVRPSFSVFPR